MSAKTALHDLGRAIRNKGIKTLKRHGSQWDLKLQSGIHFIHDDYNKAVWAVLPNNQEVYYGIDFGNFESDKTEHQIRATIDLIEAETK